MARTLLAKPSPLAQKIPGSSEMQGLVISAYAKLPFAALLLLTIEPRSKQGESSPQSNWISTLQKDITDASGPTPSALNLAFTASGLVALGVDETTLTTFARPFREGMTQADRARALGDVPSEWRWHAATKTDPVHALVLLYAKTSAALKS